MGITFRRGREVPDRRARPIVVSAIAGAAVGATVTRLLARRRLHAADKLRHERKQLRHVLRVRLALVRGHLRGFVHRLRPARPHDLDDVTLAHKVESILFRDPTVPKGRISINAERGVVFLRGEIPDDELIHDLERAVREIPDVREVENLLHLPGTPAPHPA